MADVEWHRVFLISSSILAVILICGSLYLHLQQKNHFGRLRYNKDFVTISGTEASTFPNSDSSSEESSDEISDLLFPASFNQHYDGEFPESDEEEEEDVSLDYYDAPGNYSFDLFDANEMAESERKRMLRHDMTESCLHCLCKTTTGCMPSVCADREPCGIYRISRGYWELAGRPTNDDAEGAIIDRDSAYLPCVNDLVCAARTVLEFVDSFARDCNRDGIIDCRDHIELHLHGLDCMEYDAAPNFRKRVEQCLGKAA